MENHFLSDEYLDDIAKKAILNGFTPLFDLAYIMAAEEDYRDILPNLWKLYECNVRHGTEIKTNTRKDRAGVWFILFQRWGGTVPDQSNGFSPPPYWGKVRPIQYLNLYDPVTRELKTPGQKRNENDLVKIEDLQEYLKNIEQALKLNLSLPKRLFPEAQEEEKEVTEKGNFFRKEGDFWNVSFEGVMIPKIKHLIGMDYIKYLLENPYRPVAALALVRTRPTSEEASLLIKMNEDQLEELGLTKSTSLGYKEVISKETKDNYRNKIRELDEIINDKESPKNEVSDALKEKKALIKELKVSYDKRALTTQELPSLTQLQEP